MRRDLENLLSIINNIYKSIMKAITLTPAEKSKLENEKQLYVLIRLIHLVEQYHNYDKISANDYKEEMAKLTEKYHRFTQIIPNFSLAAFIKEHDISEDEVAWAKLALEKPSGSQQEDKKKKTFLYMQATAKFIEVNDTLMACAEQPVIGEIKTPVEELILILKSIHAEIGPEFTQKYRNLERMYSVTYIATINT